MHTLAALRVIAATAGLIGLGFLIAPASANVEPLPPPGSDSVALAASPLKVQADSLAEDIILYNLFSPSRSAPNRRSGMAVSPDESSVNETMDASGGFTPELIGTAVSDKPGETKALLRLLASDPGPRLYAVGDRAGGFTVVSIDPRSVVLNGPRGRLVLRLPQDEESHS